MMNFFRIPILLIFCLLFHKVSISQELSITFSDIGKSFKYKLPPNKHSDSTFIAKTLYEFLLPLYSKGYLSASIDSFCFDSTLVRAYGIMGLQYRWVRFKTDSISQFWFNNFGMKIPRNENKIINPRRFARLTNTIIKRFEDSGYPFAKVELDSVKISRNEVSAILRLDKDPKILIDTLYLKGNFKVNHRHIMALLSLKKGEPYSESKIRLIDQKLKQQPYLSIIKPAEVEFLSNTARLYCYLNNKIASRFSGLAGFYYDKKDGEIKLNGNLNLLLVNAMKNGEKINFLWNAPGKGIQNLNVETDWPYIFASQMGVTGSFSLYKHDSTYITINPKLSISFFSQNRDRFLLNLDYKSTSFSSITLAQESQYSNTSALLYGIGYEFNSLNGLVLPTQGLYLKSSLNTGIRKLNQSNKFNSNLIEGEILVKGFVPLHENRLILALISNSKIKGVYNSTANTKLYENEMYRIGGMETIRGFNQEEILSQAYSIASAEIHLRISEGSGFYLFADKGFVKGYESGKNNDAWPLGLGIGLNLVTKSGLFNLSYALGEGFGQSISLRDAKVHFGISTVF
ncbi:MAG: BamA/TamA family outer membrane protein [Bacteroidales bacterium]|nr:BamA/TamA family outer membrane protein [Bacteroidales bacterium]